MVLVLFVVMAPMLQAAESIPSVTAARTVSPDIVLVLADDMNSDDWRALPKAMAFLTAEFPNYIHTNPLCCPSRASILTGLYPHNHGTWFTDPAPGGGGWQSFRDREHATIATMLHKAGYRTGFIGKYLNNYEPKAGTRPGWDYWYAFGKPEYRQIETVERHKIKTQRRYSTDVVAVKARAFITSSSNGPLFAFVAPYVPHEPALPPRRYTGDCRRERLVAKDKPSYGVRIIDGPGYFGGKMSRTREARLVRLERKRQCALKAFDDLLVGVQVALERRGRPYYLFVASDNGFLLGEHGYVGKVVPYDESTRTAMRATSGGGAPALHGSDNLVANIDWMETFAEIGGATPPHTTDGQSMLSDTTRELVIIEGKESPRNRRRFAEWAEVVAEVTDTPSYRGMHLATGELYVEYASGFVEYYTANDPYRLRNARKSMPERVDELSALLHRYRDCRGNACP